MRFGVIMLFSLFSPIFVYAATISNAGFIPAPLWFSRDTFFAGETVRIYTVVYNGSDSDIRGTAEFLNGDIVIGTNDFSLARGGRSQDIWIDWKATEGDSRISARIVRARATVAGGKEESIDFSQSLTAEVSAEPTPEVGSIYMWRAPVSLLIVSALSAALVAIGSLRRACPGTHFHWGWGSAMRTCCRNPARSRRGPRSAARSSPLDASVCRRFW